MIWAGRCTAQYILPILHRTLSRVVNRIERPGMGREAYGRDAGVIHIPQTATLVYQQGKRHSLRHFRLPSCSYHRFALELSALHWDTQLLE